MRLYATLENSDGKVVKLGSNESITATVYDGNKKAYSMMIDWCDIGDIIDNDGNELPESEKTKGATVSVREWRNASHAERVLDANGFTPKHYKANDGTEFKGWSKGKR